MMDLISIIVPIYKVEHYLDCCVESIINQTYQNVEIILVDDGSPDHCAAICDRWAEKDKRIKVVHKKNGGLSDARNAGMEVANGQYLGFVDSDDWIDSQYVEYLYRVIQQTGSDLSACDVKFVPDGEDVLAVEQELSGMSVNTPEEALSTLIQGRKYRAVVWNKLYKREIIQGEKFEVGRLHEDEFFTYRIYDKCKRLAYVDIPLYNYRQREGSIMSTFSVRHLDYLEAYSRRLLLLKQKYPLLYEKDKITFCIACLNYYCDACKRKFDGQKEVFSKIKDYRKKIRFSFSEWMKQPFKNKIYIIGTTAPFIRLCALVQIKRGI